MDKKLFIGATIITATVIGGLVYYRHQVRQALEDLTMDDEPDVEAMTEAERAEYFYDNRDDLTTKETDPKRLALDELRNLKNS